MTTNIIIHTHTADSPVTLALGEEALYAQLRAFDELRDRYYLKAKITAFLSRLSQNHWLKRELVAEGDLAATILHRARRRAFRGDVPLSMRDAIYQVGVDTMDLYVKSSRQERAFDQFEALVFGPLLSPAAAMRKAA